MREFVPETVSVFLAMAYDEVYLFYGIFKSGSNCVISCLLVFGFFCSTAK